MAPTFSRILSTLTAVFMLISQAPSYAQNAQNTQPPPFSAAEIEQLVAPVALYPDALLAQVLMAATYPIQVVDAARWRAAQSKNLSDQQLPALTQDKPWDPSVKSLTAFPTVLAMMNDNLDWTGDLGNAFLDQQQDVMDAVQRLRTQAHAAGNLQSGPQQTVTTSGNPPVIVIQPTQPNTVYVPVYNPSVVYGTWAYPSYPPYYYAPPSYSPGGTILGFTVGLFVGNALWGSMDWHHHDVNINVNRYNIYNHTQITSNRWQRPPQSSRWRGTEHRRNSGQRNLSGTGAGFNRPQRSSDINRGPGASRPAITHTRPDNSRPNIQHTQREQPRARSEAADQRPNSLRPNLPTTRPGSTRSNALTEPSSNPRNGASEAHRNSTRPHATSRQRSTSRPDTPTGRPSSQRPATAPTRPNTQRPETASPARPSSQRPAAAPQPPSSQRPRAAQPRPNMQRPSPQRPAATPQRPNTQRPAAAPPRPNIQRPAAAPERQRPAASSERRGGSRSAPSDKRRGEGR